MIDLPFNQAYWAEQESFADDAFSSRSRAGITVVAQIGNNADLIWANHTRNALGLEKTELGYRSMMKDWQNLGSDNQAAVMKGISQAMIFICDSGVYERQFEDEIIVPLMGRRMAKMAFQQRQFFQKHAEGWSVSKLVIGSPIWRITSNLPYQGIQRTAGFSPEKRKSAFNARIVVGRMAAAPSRHEQSF